MSAEHSSVRVANTDFRRGKLYVNRLYEYVVPKDVQLKSGKILTDWFTRARRSMRIQGGDLERPFVKAGTPVHMYHGRYTDQDFIVKHLKSKDFLKENGERICPLRDIILQNKIDIKSISIVMYRARHGDQKLVNVKNRFRTEYRADLMLILLDAATLEDS